MSLTQKKETDLHSVGAVPKHSQGLREKNNYRPCHKHLSLSLRDVDSSSFIKSLNLNSFTPSTYRTLQ